MDAERRTAGPDLSGLRIDESARNNKSGRGRLRAGLLSGAVVLAVLAAAVFFRGRAPLVEVAVAKPAGEAGSATLLNASGYVTPRRRATVAAKITARVLDVLVDEGMACIVTDTISDRLRMPAH